eukprot:gene20146-26155_t
MSLGRKTTLVYQSLIGVFIIIWSATGSNSADLLTSRAAVGWIVGIGLAVGPIYITEMASSTDRGQLVGFIGLFTVIGWWISTVFPALFLIIQGIGLTFVLPLESPRWLISRKTPGASILPIDEIDVDQSSLVWLFLIFSIISILVGFFVIIAIPETTGLMIENMEELFAIDNHEVCCYCCYCCYFESSAAVVSTGSLASITTPSRSGGYGSLVSHTLTNSTDSAGTRTSGIADR